MAEFCLDCFNKHISNRAYKEKEVITDLDFCEYCKEWKPCVITIKEKNIFKRIKRRISVEFRLITEKFRK